MRAAEIPIGEFIDQHGAVKSAELFEVNRSTLYRWTQSARPVVVHLNEAGDAVRVVEEKIHWEK